MIIMQTPRLGFRVLGSPTSRRRLINLDTAFAAHAACDSRAEVDRESYLSAFSYGGEFRQYLTETGSTRGYDGPCAAPWLWFDLDAEELNTAIADARRLATGILRRYTTLDDDDLLLFFSGSKGAHVGLPVAWETLPSVAFHRAARCFAEGLAAETGTKIDVGVYDKVRLFRAPNSRHPKTGLYKRRLTLDELLCLDADRIRQLAAAPDPFDVPAVAAADPQAVADWQAALRAVQTAAEEKANRHAAAAGGTPSLNRATLAYIRGGADHGDRHRLLFSAAANLAEFGCPSALAHALLTEAALDSGLTPNDVRRQIDCGLSHSRAVPTAPKPPIAATGIQERLAALWARTPADNAGNAWEVPDAALPPDAMEFDPAKLEGGIQS
jgi:hypothetical protein